MIFPAVVIFTLAFVLTLIAYRRKDGTHLKGFKIAKQMGFSLIPLLIAAFAVSGLIEVVIPPQAIQGLFGDQTGLRGIVTAAGAGALLPGGPYVTFPIIASVFKCGAGIGTIVAFITGWAMLGIGIIPFEIAFIGPRFTALRVSLVIFIPIIAGAAAQALF